MSDLKKDILVSVLFIFGIFGFMAGEFIVSTVIFATAAILSNVSFDLKSSF